MLVSDIFIREAKVQLPNLHIIKHDCAQFLRETNSPLFKNLTNQYANVQKVKIRHRKRKDQFDQAFNEAFQNDIPNLVQRSIFAYGGQDPELKENQESFYIFPTNGYQFLYSQDVDSSSEDYKNAFDIFLEKFNHEDNATQILKEILKYNYVSSNLQEGLEARKEIILYNIPFYYAVRANTVDYPTLLTLLR